MATAQSTQMTLKTGSEPKSELDWKKLKGSDNIPKRGFINCQDDQSDEYPTRQTYREKAAALGPERE